MNTYDVNSKWATSILIASTLDLHQQQMATIEWQSGYQVSTVAQCSTASHSYQ